MKKFFLIPLYYTIICIAVPLVVTYFNRPAVDGTMEESSISVFNHITNESTTMLLEDYLVGVVSAEMPALFEDEALKAQAVAARTYTFYKAGSEDHREDVCTDPGHCQAYYTQEDMVNSWQNDHAFYFDKIKKAVYSTKGQYLEYENEPAMAVFHSMGGGKTENSADVWGEGVPYLVSVASPGEDVASNYNSSLSLSFDEFKSTVLSAYPHAVINSSSDVSAPTLTEGGHVKSIVIGGEIIKGTDMRRLFNLRSTKFDITFSENTVIFSVTGYGHGVGMSQYGANAMAKNGAGYQEILSHYYPGTTLVE